MLVEFIGFSSTGKTTLLKEISLLLGNKKINFNNIELEFLNKNYSYKEKQRFLFFFLNCKTIFLFLFRFFSVNDIKDVLQLLKLTNLSLFRKVSYFRNYIKKISLVKFYIKEKHKKILLFDEGFIQGKLNILNHINNDRNNLNLKSIRSDYYPDILICLKCDTNKLIKKIKQRNDRKYWSSLSDLELKKNINRFNINMEQIIDYYRKNNQKKVLIVSSSDFDRKYIIDFLINELKLNNQNPIN